jgi:peptide/nickel transport system permease protein
MIRLFCNRLFLFGITLIGGLLVISFLYSYYLKEIIPTPEFMLYDDNNRLIDKAPYPPSWQHPFGVDRYGEDVFWKVVDGAKYTIAIALVVSIFRVLLGTLSGIVYAFYLSRFRTLVDAVIRAYRFIPIIFLTLLFLVPLQLAALETGSGKTSMPLQMVILIVAALPMLTGLIGNEISVFLKNEFIDCSRLLGAGNLHLLRKHVIPYLRPRLLLYVVQQTVQTLLLLVHLGVLGVLVGGIKEVVKGDIFKPEKAVLSLSNEWSGLIGLSYRELMLDQWIVLGPCIAFSVSIFAFNLIAKGIEQVLSERKYVTFHELHSNTQSDWNDKQPFDFIHKKDVRQYESRGV